MVVATHIRLSELAHLLGMEPRSGGATDGNHDLTRGEISWLVRVADVLYQAERVLGDRKRGLEWLKHRNRALSFKTPLEQLATGAGTRRVLALLGRMARGGFA